ncbi:hypothetical protein [Hymenobacter terricola]|uniref:hypothetical protein n=1 Tax=Hymenobacter terricola TaxID=2819236 RepID=UPI001CF36AED|nr:hypothetical protein [Hymenobacter terricola]
MKSEGLLPNDFNGRHTFFRRFGQPEKHILHILVGVQSGFAGNGFIEAEHG